MFNKNDSLIGINIERDNGNSLVICAAFKDGDKWKVKTLSGCSGDLDDDKLIDKVISEGHLVDRETASLIFSRFAQKKLEYSSDNK